MLHATFVRFGGFQQSLKFIYAFQQSSANVLRWFLRVDYDERSGSVRRFETRSLGPRFVYERFPEAEVTALFVVDTSLTSHPEKYVGVKLGEIYEQRTREGEAVLEEAEAVAAEFDGALTTARLLEGAYN